MSPPARACARFGGFARGRWRIAMGGEGTRAKAANRRGANRGRPRRGAAFVRSDRGDRDDCGSCGSCGSCGRARVRRDARPRRDVRFAFWRSNARHHSNPRETTPSAASPRSDIARVARLQVCGRASAFGAASARTRTHAGVPRTRRRFGRALFGSLISNGVTSADVMVAAAVADARCRPRSSASHGCGVGARRGRQSIGTSYAARACRP